VAAVYGRQIPRPDCKAVYARDYERCFGRDRESSKWDHFFSMVSSGIRRDAWTLRGFNEAMQYSEDDEYTRWCRAQGYAVRYCPDSVVMHSHNYTFRQAYRRSFGEAWALAGIGQAAGNDPGPGRSVFFRWLRDALGDLRFCARRRRIGEWPHALGIRWQRRLGGLHGFQAGWQMHRVDRVL
jgi:rhamnosyltransferase